MKAESYRIVQIPQLGVNDVAVTITGWYLANGTIIRRGEPICGLETSKATFDVEAECDGVLMALHPAGAKLLIDEPLGIVFNSDQAYEQLHDELAKRYTTATAVTDSRPKATHQAVKLAEDLHVNLTEVPSTGVIRERDVRAFARSSSKPLGHAAIEFRSDAKNIVIYGSGRGAYTICDCVRQLPGYHVTCYVDDDPARVGELEGVPVLPSAALATDQRFRQVEIATEIANGAVRARIFATCDALDIRVTSVIHPSVILSPTARIGRGCYIKSGAIVETSAIVGDGCIIDNGVIIPHDNQIGDFCHIAPGVVLGSSVSVGDHTVVGIAAAISTGITIGRNCIIAVGAAVTKNIPDNSVAEGVPARVIGERSPT